MSRLLPTLLLLSTIVACGGDKKKDERRRDDSEASASARSDADKSGSDELSHASRRIACEAAKQDFTIDFYITRDKLTEKGAAAAEALLERYKNATYKGSDGKELKSKIKTRVVEIKTDSDKTIATAEGVTEQTFSEAQGPNSAIVMRGFFGFVFKYAAEKEVMPWWPPDDADSLEYLLTTRMRDMQMRSDRSQVRVGLVTKKDELSLEDPDLMPGQVASVAQLFRTYFPSYSLEPVDLRDGDAPIDPGLRALVITQPGKPYNEKELRRVDEFAMRGGKGVLIAASAVNLVQGDGTMTATLDRRGLEKLTAGYGMELRNEAVLDFEQGLQYQARGTMGENVLARMPGIFMASAVTPGTQLVDTSSAAFFRLEDLAFPYPSPIVLHPEKQPDAKQRVLARTGAKATLDTRDVKTMAPSDKLIATGPEEQRVIAVTLEGELATAFPQGDNLGIVVPAKSPAPSRVLFISASQFFANPFVVSGRPRGARDPLGVQLISQGFAELGNAYAQGHAQRLMLAFKYGLDWTTADQDVAELAARLKPVVRKDTKTPPASSGSVLDMFKK